MPDRAERRLRCSSGLRFAFFSVALFSEMFVSDVSTDDLLHILFRERSDSPAVRQETEEQEVVLWVLGFTHKPSAHLVFPSSPPSPHVIASGSGCVVGVDLLIVLTAQHFGTQSWF